MEIAWIGADWDSEKCVVEVKSGDSVRRETVRRDPEAVRRFVADLGARAVMVGIEAGDPLWAHLWEAQGATVFIFDPKKAKRYAESLDSGGASDDKRSASSLRSLVMSEDHRRRANQLLPPELRGLDRLVSLKDTQSAEVVRHTNRLNALLKQVHPALLQHLPTLTAKAALDLLEAAPTAQAWHELDPDRQTAVLKGFRVKRRGLIQAVVGQDWTGFGPLEEAAARIQVRTAVLTLRALNSSFKQANQELAAATRENAVAQKLTTIGGIGPFLGAGTTIALGATTGRDGISRRTGTAPVTVRSGKKGDDHPLVMMRRSASGSMRKVGFLLAVQLVAHHRWAKSQFAYYRASGIPSAGAYRRISRSFGRVLHAIVRDNADFDPDRYVAALKAKGVPWAMSL